MMLTTVAVIVMVYFSFVEIKTHGDKQLTYTDDEGNVIEVSGEEMD